MLTVIVLSIVVPSVAAATFMALRGRLPIPVADKRGIALQTIIVMVVLLAIAGAVAAVLLNRAGSETDRLENETVNYAEHTNKFACDTAGGTWTPGTDGNSDGDTDDEGEGTCAA